MVFIEKKHRYQKALYWAASGFDSAGEVTIDAHVEIKVRWEDVQDEIIDDRGNHILVDAVVVVDREIPVGSILWKGGEDDIEGTGDEPTSDFRTVVRYSKIPDLRDTVSRQLVYLARHSNELPAYT